MLESATSNNLGNFFQKVCLQIHMENRPKNGGVLRAFAVTSAIGVELAIMVTLGFYGGRILDRSLGTGPWLMIAGILLGVAFGTWGIVKILETFWEERE